MTDTRDPFKFARNDDDAEIPLLFGRWIEAMRDADAACDDDQAAYEAAVARSDDIEREIAAVQGGAVALAAKLVFFLRVDALNNWTPQAAALRCPELHTEPDFGTALIASMLRDAAVALPEITELAAAIIHEDAALIDADMEITWCRDQLAEKPHWCEPAGRRMQIRDALKAAFKRIDELPAATARGREIKERVAQDATIIACLCRHDRRELAVPWAAPAASQAEVDLPALRERVAAIVTEFDLPLPEGDAGIFEADRRYREINEQRRLLSKDFEITAKIEAAEIIPHTDRLEDALITHLEDDAEPQTLAAAAVMLRHAVESGAMIQPDAGGLRNVLALVEREGGGA